MKDNTLSQEIKEKVSFIKQNTSNDFISLFAVGLGITHLPLAISILTINEIYKTVKSKQDLKTTKMSMEWIVEIKNNSELSVEGRKFFNNLIENKGYVTVLEAEELIALEQAIKEQSYIKGEVKESNGLFEDMSSKIHTMIYGETGSSKSIIIAQMAKEKNMSYKDFFDKYCYHLEEDKEKLSSQEEYETRINILKETYFEITPIDDFYIFSDIFSELLDCEEVSNQKIKELYLICPSLIFCEGLKWGFDESVVRDELYDYFRKNIDKVKSILEDK